MNMESWRGIPDYNGYEASTLGRVRSLHRLTDRGRRWKGRIMTPSIMPSGYQTVTLWREGYQKTHLVHRLVLLTFVGPPPEGFEALHGDGDPANNTLANLEWGTHSDNQFDQVAHGTHTNAAKDSCPLGHPYDEQNTYIYPGRSKRGCRACRRRWAANQRHIKRAFA